MDFLVTRVPFPRTGQLVLSLLGPLEATCGRALLGKRKGRNALSQTHLTQQKRDGSACYVGYSRLSFDALVSSYVVGRDVALELVARTDRSCWQEKPRIPPALVGCIQHFKLIPSSEAQVLLRASLVVKECHKSANVHQMLARQRRQRLLFYLTLSVFLSCLAVVPYRSKVGEDLADFLILLTVSPRE